MAVIHVTNRAGKTHTIPGKVGNTVMEILRDANMDVEAICGGSCSCATCHVFVDDAWLAMVPARGADELELVEQTGSYKEGSSHLSCQIKFTEALDGLTLTVAPSD